MTDFTPAIGTWWREDSPEIRLSGYLELIDTNHRAFNWRIHIDGDLGTIEIGYDTGVTLFGDTSEGLMTLQHAMPTQRPASFTPSSKKGTSRWEGYTLLKGGHISADQRFRLATFQIPRSIDWIGPSMLNAYSRAMPLPDESYYEGSKTLENISLACGTVFTAGLSQSSLFAPLNRRHEYEWIVSYRLSRTSGLTLEDILRLAFGMSQIQSLAFGTHMESYNLNLTVQNSSDPYQQVQVVDPHLPAGSEWQGICPFFDTSEVDFEEFINNWLNLLGQASLINAVIPSRTHTNSDVQLSLLAQCATLETIAQYNWDQPGLKESDNKILDALKQQKIRSRDISMVTSQLRQRRWPLQKKLITAALMLGPESSNKLLGDVSVWAHLVMRLRNSLTHGAPLPGGLDENHEFVIELQQSLEVVLQLAIMQQTGYQNRLSAHNGELLWAGSKTVASHINSSLFRKANSISGRSSQWAHWYRLIQPSATQ